MYLLDTYALLWFIFNNPKLSERTLSLITSAGTVYVSMVSLWEIAIKRNINKLKIDYSTSELVQLCDSENLEILQILPTHIDALCDLDLIHNDPLDRLLIAQAMSEDLTFVTCDAKNRKYPIKTIW